jgi:hypothetical protein
LATFCVLEKPAIETAKQPNIPIAQKFKVKKKQVRVSGRWPHCRLGTLFPDTVRRATRLQKKAGYPGFMTSLHMHSTDLACQAEKQASPRLPYRRRHG